MSNPSLDSDTSTSFEALCRESKALCAIIQVEESIIVSEIQSEQSGIPDYSEDVLRLVQSSRLRKRALQNCSFHFPESTYLVTLFEELSFVLCFRELERSEGEVTLQMERFLRAHQHAIKTFASELEDRQVYNEKVMLITQSIRLKSVNYYYDDSTYTREDQESWLLFRDKLKKLLLEIMSDAQTERLIERTLRKHRIPGGPKVRDIGKVSAEMIQQIPHRVRRRDLLANLQALLVQENLIERKGNILQF